MVRAQTLMRQVREPKAPREGSRVQKQSLNNALHGIRGGTKKSRSDAGGERKSFKPGVEER
jgi:hypothetical protein